MPIKFTFFLKNIKTVKNHVCPEILVNENKLLNGEAKTTYVRKLVYLFMRNNMSIS